MAALRYGCFTIASLCTAEERCIEPLIKDVDTFFRFFDPPSPHLEEMKAKKRVTIENNHPTEVRRYPSEVPTPIVGGAAIKKKHL